MSSAVAPMSMSADLEAIHSLLEQGCDVAARTSPDEWTAPDASFRNSSLGQHFRHALDHVAALVDGLESGRIDYDARRRDPAIEAQPEAAVAFARRLCESLAELGARHPETTALVVRSSCRCDEIVGEGGSTFGRELQFLVSHTVHHFAIMGSICHRLGMETSGDFGMAPSTLKHRQANAG